MIAFIYQYTPPPRKEVNPMAKKTKHAKSAKKPAPKPKGGKGC